MKKEKFTIRERKFGDNRLRILKDFLKRLQKAEMEDIHVTEVCDKVGLSKVTFFNYFPTKGAVIYYAMKLWEFEESYYTSLEADSTRDAIQSFLDRMFQTPYFHNFILAYIEYIVTENGESKGEKLDIEISRYERYKFNKKAYFVGSEEESFAQIVKNLTSKSKLKDDVSEKLSFDLMSVFFGTIVSYRLTKENDMEYLKSLIEDRFEEVYKKYKI